MKGMTATDLGPRTGRIDIRERGRAFFRTSRKFRALGTPPGRERKSHLRQGDGVEPRARAVRVKPDPDNELLEELRKSLTWMKALEGLKADRTPKQASKIGRASCRERVKVR